MGAVNAPALRWIDAEIELRREAKEFARWTLSDVQQLHGRFQKTFGLAVTASQFDDLLLLKAPEAVASKEVFDALDINRDGRIDGLELLAALVCVCRATFEEKAQFAFELFDFNDNGSLSATELALLMKSVWIGMGLLTDQSASSSNNASNSSSYSSLNVMMACLELAESAFRRYDKDGSDTLGYDEFVAWARSNRSFMLQVEQFRLVAEKVTGFEEELSLPDGSDEDSDLDEENSDVLSVPPKAVSPDQIPASLHSRVIVPAEPGSAVYSDGNQTNSMPPPVNLELDWVYGTNGPRSRNNCRFLSSGEIVYTVANYAVVYSSARHEQRYYRRHKRFIQCLDVNGSGEIVATADGNGAASSPNSSDAGAEIHVWNGNTLQCLAILRNFHEQGISHVAFPAPKSAATSAIHNAHAQPIGSGASSSLPSSHLSKKTHRHTDMLLASIGSDVNASMALWNWQQETVLASGRALGTGTSALTKSRRRPLAMALSEDGDEIVVCGTHFVVFHQVDGRFFKQKQPQLLRTSEQERRASPLLHSIPNCLSVAYYGVQDVVVGTARGKLLRFQRRKLTQVIQAHEPNQSVTTTLLSYRSMVLFTAGKDGQIKQWDSTLKPIGSPIDLHTFLGVNGVSMQSPKDREAAVVLKNEDFRVSSLAYDPRRHRFLVATRLGNIIEFTDEPSSTAANTTGRDSHIVASGHTKSCLSGTVTANLGTCFASFSASAKCIKLWCLRRRLCTAQLRLTTFSPVSLAFSNGCDLLLVSGHEGSLMLCSICNMALAPLTTMKNTSAVAAVIRFAPDDQTVAVGRSNGLVYIYRIEDAASDSEGGEEQRRSLRLSRYALLRPHQYDEDATSTAHSITSLDFSMNGNLLRSERGDGLTLYWDLRRRACSQLSSSAPLVRTAQWHTYSCQVRWQESNRTDKVQSSYQLVASHSKKLGLLTSSDSGDVGVTGLPCSSRTPAALAKMVQCAHIVTDSSPDSWGGGDTGLAPICSGDFALRDSYAITSSQGSAAICQWRVEEEMKDTQPHPPCDYGQLFTKLASLGLDDVYFPASTNSQYDLPASSNVTVGSSQSMVVTASVAPATCTEAPDLDLSLSYAFGFNCKRTSINRMIAPSASRLIYSVDTLLVSRRLQGGGSTRYNITRSRLRHTISCIAHHPSLPVTAVGSRDDGMVIFFSPNDNNTGLREVAAITSDAGTFGKTLITVSFLDSEMWTRLGASNTAGNTDLVAVIWKNDQHVHSLVFYAWKKQQSALIASAQMTKSPVLFGEFVSAPSHQQDGDSDYPAVYFVSGGVNHVTFWKLNAATGIISSQQGVFGHHALVQTMLCAVSVGGFLLTGAEDGSLVVWADGVAAHTYPAPSVVPTFSEPRSVAGAVSNGLLALSYTSSRRQVIGATHDGGIILWQCNTDQQTVKPGAFLQVVRTSSVFSLNWQLQDIQGGGQAMRRDGTGSESMKQRGKTRLVGFQLLEESSDALAVLSSGEILRLEFDLFASPSNDLAGQSNSANGDGRLLISEATVMLNSIPDAEDIALHPREPWIALCSASGVLCVWNLTSNQLVHSRQFQSTGEACAVCWSGRGSRLAVSFSNGSVHVLNGANLDEEIDVFKIGESKTSHYASMLKYAPATSDGASGCMLALACTDFNVYVYTGPQEPSGRSTEEKVSHSLIHTFVGHSSPVTALDFSLDGKWLQSASSCHHHQILRWPLQPSEDTPSRSTNAIECSLSDDQWATWTLPLSGPVAGVEELWGTSVSTLCRIQGEEDDKKWHSRLPTMGIGTESGHVLLSWYPLAAGTACNAMAKEYSGFFSTCTTVARAEFSRGNEFLVTLGRNHDGQTSVLIWRTDYEDELRQLQRLQAARDGPNETPTPLIGASTTSSVGETYCASEELTNLFTAADSDAKGDEFLAVRPWAGAIREPTSYVECKDNPTAPPEQELHLDFVYGVNAGATASNSAFYADDAWEIVYTSASIGIVYNTKTQSQLLHQSHGSNAISALAVHPRGDLVVTGECGVSSKQSPRIILWDANSGSTMVQVNTVHARGVLLLSVAPSGEQFASIGMEDDHLLAIYAIVNGRSVTGSRSNAGNNGLQEGGGLQVQLLTHVKTSKQRVWGLCINDEGEAVTCGEQHLLFYRRSSTASSQSGSNADADSAASVKRALFSSHKKCNARATVLQAAYLFKPQMVISSQSDGSLYLWKDRKCVDVKLAAHGNTPIPALSVDRRHQWVFSGGHDGKICVWNAQLESLRAIDFVQLAAATLTNSPPLTSTKIQSLVVRDGRILIVTAGSEMCELMREDDAALKGQSAPRGVDMENYRLVVHQRGHAAGELWGLDTHPTKLQFATAGDDGTVRLWDSPTRSLLALYRWEGAVKLSQKRQPQHQLRALAFSSDGSHLAVGASDGVVRVLSAGCDAVITEWKESSHGIRALKYSPDGSVLAVSSQDRHVHLLDARTYRKLGELRGHTSAVSHMDFSKDGGVLQTVSVGAGELLFWDVRAKKQITSASAVRDTQWETWSCPFGWPVQGIYPPESDDSDVNAVSRSRDRRVVATGGDDCCVRLFRHPCVPRGRSVGTATPSSSASNPVARVYVGHASHVTNCMFTANDAFMLSTGGRDQTICQFRYVPSNSGDGAII